MKIRLFPYFSDPDDAGGGGATDIADDAGGDETDGGDDGGEKTIDLAKTLADAPDKKPEAPDNGKAKKETVARPEFLKADYDEEALKTINRFKDPDALAKSYLEARKSMGGMVKLPTAEGATKEDIKAFFQKVGGIDKPEEYKLERLELPDGLEYEDELEKAFRSAAASRMLTQSQAAEAWRAVQQARIESFNGYIEQIQTEREEAQNQLVTDLGGEDKYKEAVVDAERAIDTFGRLSRSAEDNALRNLLTQENLLNNPVIVRVFSRIGKSISDDQLIVTEDPLDLIVDENYEPTGEFHYDHLPPGAKNRA